MTLKKALIDVKVTQVETTVTTRMGRDRLIQYQIFVSPIANCQIFTISGAQSILTAAGEIQMGETQKTYEDRVRSVVRTHLEECYIISKKRIALVDVCQHMIPYFDNIPGIKITYSMNYVSTHNKSNRVILFLENQNHGK